MGDALSKLEQRFGVKKEESEIENDYGGNSRASNVLKNYRAVSDIKENL